MSKTLLKGLIAALIAFVAAYFGSSTVFDWVYVAVYTIGFTVVYLATNAKWPSKSPLGFIDVWDLLKGLCLAVGAGVVNWAAQLLSGAEFTWHALWVTVSGTAVAYILSKFGWGPKTAKVDSSITTPTK